MTDYVQKSCKSSSQKTLFRPDFREKLGINSPNVEKPFHKELKFLSGSDFDPCQADFMSCKGDLSSCGNPMTALLIFPEF